ncbi:hypothetical protein GF373_06930 [bacterium]|nr:hypothetical protein [bacterium]
MRMIHFIQLFLILLMAIGSISPAYSDFHTDYSNIFTIDNRAFIPGGSHTGYSNLFTIDNRLSPPGSSHTGYSNLFSIDNRDSVWVRDWMLFE